MGQTVNAPQYVPETVLTREIREKADLLDEKIKKNVDLINESFKKLKAGRLDEIDKWRWLGEQVDNILNNVDGIEQKDIDNNIIWLAIGQYLSDDLRRSDDIKRSGTAKDHLRKCWLLFKTKNTNWINNWAGWDALVDRGEQLVSDERLLRTLDLVFIKHKKFLSSRDYQYIFKKVAENVPSGGSRKDLDLIKPAELRKIVESVEKEWLVEKKN